MQPPYGLNDLVQDLAEKTKEFVGEQISPMQQRLGDLEQQLATLKREVETTLTTLAALSEKAIDQGVWRADALYRSGDLVSDRGSAWIARQTTSQRPGESSHWRLAAKGRS